MRVRSSVWWTVEQVLTEREIDGRCFRYVKDVAYEKCGPKDWSEWREVTDPATLLMLRLERVCEVQE